MPRAAVCTGGADVHPDGIRRAAPATCPDLARWRRFVASFGGRTAICCTRRAATADPFPASDLAPTLVAGNERPHTVGGRLLGGELEPPTVPLGAALAGLYPPGSSVLV